MRVEFEMDDISGVLEGGDKDTWKLLLTDITEYGEEDNMVNQPEPGVTEIELDLNTTQAAAIMALAIGYGEEDNSNPLIVKALYDAVEPLLKDVPTNLRPIP